jgi:predicted oxidoreductase (fatty acid repression mutant protein)
MHPLVFPNQGGSTLFVYHQTAVREFRDYAVRVGQFAPASKRAKMIKLWTEIAEMQLGATLTHLGPANDVGLFPVTVKTNGGGGGRRMGK